MVGAWVNVVLLSFANSPVNFAMKNDSREDYRLIEGLKLETFQAFHAPFKLLSSSFQAPFKLLSSSFQARLLTQVSSRTHRITDTLKLSDFNLSVAYFYSEKCCTVLFAGTCLSGQPSSLTAMPSNVTVYKGLSNSQPNLKGFPQNAFPLPPRS
jgi:hypothetical protein